jgi:hypothetical protein
MAFIDMFGGGSLVTDSPSNFYYPNMPLEQNYTNL